MQRRVNVLAVAMMAFAAGTAGAADLPLTAGKLAKLFDKSGTAADQAIIKVVKDPVLQGLLPGPLCPVVSTVRLRTDSHDLLIQLDCSKWGITGSGYAYKDPTGSAGGVQKVQIASKSSGGKLLIKMKGDPYGVSAFAGPAAFLEAELVIGATGWCARFEAPTSTFAKNAADKLLVKGPSIACIPPPTATATITNTPTITRTPTETRTPSLTPTASLTMTPSKTATVTATGTATWTATDTFTAAPTSTATLTRTATNTATITATATVTWTGQATATDTITPTPSPTPIPPSVFRIDSLALRDPHVFVTVIACTDLTNNFAGLSVNEQIAAQLTKDSEPDGYYDLSVLASFRPLNQPPLPGATIELGTGHCTAMPNAEVCDSDGSTPGSTLYNNQSSGVCLSPLPGTTGANNVGNYSPVMSTSSAPCFNTIPVDITFPFGVFTIPLQNVVGSGTYNTDPATQLQSGLLYGFLSETDANAIILPSSIPLVGGQPLSKYLPGGMGCCATHTAKDIGPNSQPGWYFYLNYTAHKVTWIGQ